MNSIIFGFIYGKRHKLFDELVVLPPKKKSKEEKPIRLVNLFFFGIIYVRGHYT